MNSTCSSFAPNSYLEDFEVFPERDESLGSVYVEAADKVTLKKIRDSYYSLLNEISQMINGILTLKRVID